MTNLYLIRHGIAADREAYVGHDAVRPLTETGERKTGKIARRLYELGLRFEIILTSPLTRARQTAEILKEAGLTDNLEEFQSLAPAGELSAWLDWLTHWSPPEAVGNLALVGHQPDLGNWAETLVWGQVRERLVLKKAGMIGLTLPRVGSPIGQSLLFWLTPPRFLL